jgi:trehalose/maltose transport system substrate-binding protein
MKLRHALLAFVAGSALLAGTAYAAETISIVAGATGRDLEVLQQELKDFEAKTGNHVNVVTMPSSTSDQFGQYKLWLAAQNPDIDVYRTDVIWAPQLASQFIDLTEATKDVAKDHFPAIIQSQTVNGKLVALPVFTDAPALYYRKDLLDKYGAKVPTTWKEMADTAKMIMDKERAAGNKDMWGFVFQGNAYEGLTCDALEWVKSNEGGQIVEPDGKVSINNPKAAEALDMVKGWIGTISPPGVLSYQEEESRGVWQTGNAVFMRNWPYAYSLGNSADSAVKGKFDVTTLPVGPSGKGSAATLGGWNLAVSKYTKHKDAAIALVKFLASTDSEKKYEALQLSHLPTIISLYDDKDIASAQPIIPRWKDIFLNAVPRPSAPTQKKYNEVSKDFWSAVHDTLSGTGSAADNLKKLDGQLKRLKGSDWES